LKLLKDIELLVHIFAVQNAYVDFRH